MTAKKSGGSRSSNPGRGRGKARSFVSAERVEDGDRRQYHIGLAPGEVERSILLVGDPARAERVARRMSKVRVEKRHREFVTFTGRIDDLELSVMATGIGCDNTEIAVVELSQIVSSPCFIRAGTCGALQKDMKLEDLVISTGALRLENTSTYFVHEGFPAVAHWQVVAALVAAAEEGRRRHHVGITATAPGFYGAQGRRDSGFEPRFPDLPDQLARMGVKNLEMETSTLFTLSAMRGFRAGAVCTVFANRPKNRFIAPDRKIAAEEACLDVAIAALGRLSS